MQVILEMQNMLIVDIVLIHLVRQVRPNILANN